MGVLEEQFIELVNNYMFIILNLVFLPYLVKGLSKKV